MTNQKNNAHNVINTALTHDELIRGGMALKSTYVPRNLLSKEDIDKAAAAERKKRAEKMSKKLRTSNRRA